MSKAILVHLPDELAAALKAEKARTGCAVAEFIRRAVTAALDRQKKAENDAT